MLYFFLLAILNFIDGIVTYWGLSNDWIGEANPLMNWLWLEDPNYFLALKVFLSVALVIVGFYFTSFSFKGIWRFTLKTVNIVYGIVLLLHFYWVTVIFI